MAPANAGRVMHHEHVMSLIPGSWTSGGMLYMTNSSARQNRLNSDEATVAIGALKNLKALGFNTVVDLSPYGVVGRDSRAKNLNILKKISNTTGLHLVAGSSTYLETFAPAWAKDLDEEGLHKRFVKDATVGIGDSDIKAGIFGEQATGLGVISPFEARALRAAAKASKETGLALTTHTTHGTMALEQIDLISAAADKAHLDRVLIGHMDIQSELDYQRRVLDAGVSIAFDTIGKQFWDFVLSPISENPPEGPLSKMAYYRADVSRADRIAELIKAGYVEKILLSQDLTGPEIYLNPKTYGQWGFSYLGAVFVPMLKARGVTDAQITTMLTKNPVRLLTIA
ncbi:phosphotriesterase family protein [Bifidobacterium tibiigranuli]|nr:hypothetical protein [Bifidobacterium tibiigranuli]